jgi:hypothetical protein
MWIKFSDKTDFKLLFYIVLILLYLQFGWLPKERNAVYTAWNVDNIRVTNTVLEVRYDAISSICA